jgi:hypothetical protein
MELGGKFWFGVIGVVVGICLAAWLGFLIIGWAWASWGFFGAMFLFAVIAIGGAWLYDRREAKRRRGLTG